LMQAVPASKMNLDTLSIALKMGTPISQKSLPSADAGLVIAECVGDLLDTMTFATR